MDLSFCAAQVTQYLSCDQDLGEWQLKTSNFDYRETCRTMFETVKNNVNTDKISSLSLFQLESFFSYD